MDSFPSDAEHDASDKMARNLNNRTDRLATHARFTPLDDEGMPYGTPVEIRDAHIRVTTRWTGGADLTEAVLLTATVDDPHQGKNLPLHKRYQIEIMKQVPESDEWTWRAYAVVNVTGSTVTPGWATVHGYVQPTRTSYEEKPKLTGAPVWLTPSGGRS